jgi:integrase
VVRLLAYLHLMTEQRAVGLRAVQRDGRWRLDGAGPADLMVINEFLGYVADRGYSPRTERAYAFDLLAFARWLVDQDLTVGGVTTDALLRFLTFCRAAVLPGQAGGNVVPLRTGRSTGYAPSTINRRMAAISGLFDFRAMRDPTLVNPVPRSAAARRSSTAQRGGLLAHLDRPKSRSRLRVREPRRLPRGLDRAETAALLGSFRSDRDRAIAGLMLFSGLRSAEVLALQVRDVDIPRRWVRVVGKWNSLITCRSAGPAPSRCHRPSRCTARTPTARCSVMRCRYARSLTPNARTSTPTACRDSQGCRGLAG